METARSTARSAKAKAKRAKRRPTKRNGFSVPSHLKDYLGWPSNEEHFPKWLNRKTLLSHLELARELSKTTGCMVQYEPTATFGSVKDIDADSRGHLFGFYGIDLEGSLDARGDIVGQLRNILLSHARKLIEAAANLKGGDA